MKKSIRKRTAVEIIAKEYRNAPEYLFDHIMQNWPGTTAQLSALLRPLLMKLTAKRLSYIINNSINDSDELIHVKTT